MGPRDIKDKAEIKLKELWLRPGHQSAKVGTGVDEMTGYARGVQRLQTCIPEPLCFDDNTVGPRPQRRVLGRDVVPGIEPVTRRRTRVGE